MVNSDAYREVLAQFPSGVTVITASTDRQMYGLTLSAFSAVSLSPPLILVCIDNNSNTLPAVKASQRFTVNILHKSAEQTALTFAAKRDDKFSDIEFQESPTGPILIEDSIAYLGCRVVNIVKAGDHHVVIGQVQSAEVLTDRQALVYCNRAFARAAPLGD